jgi:hypothetical protein
MPATRDPHDRLLAICLGLDRERAAESASLPGGPRARLARVLPDRTLRLLIWGLSSHRRTRP